MAQNREYIPIHTDYFNNTMKMYTLLWKLNINFICVCKVIFPDNIVLRKECKFCNVLNLHVLKTEIKTEKKKKKEIFKEKMKKTRIFFNHGKVCSPKEKNTCHWFLLCLWVKSWKAAFRKLPFISIVSPRNSYYMYSLLKITSLFDFCFVSG